MNWEIFDFLIMLLKLLSPLPPSSLSVLLLFKFGLSQSVILINFRRLERGGGTLPQSHKAPDYLNNGQVIFKRESC
ncbi:hypothetical protein XELAEV_18038410mg [Xenopus laevis]|uniref:Secreted protein n=1 Tax=Xenopus laevis TaxID=8355 RepID=A0A974H6Y3_XENLA|nr:hypothetical protein XELAEV_18038410mg [Xenopus laevis]